MPLAPEGTKRTATIHSHVTVVPIPFHNHFYSGDDIKNMKARGVPSYLAAPGMMLRITETNSEGKKASRTIYSMIKY